MDTPSNAALKKSYPVSFWSGLALAAVAHFMVLALWPAFSVTADASPPDDMIAIETFDPTIPPPPEEIVRPSVPIVGDLDLADAPDLPIDFWDRLPYEPIGAPPVTPDERPEGFTVYDVAPRVVNRADVRRILERHYPAPARGAGITGTTVLAAYIDEEGEMREVRVELSSGHRTLDEAALRAAREFRFAPGLNRDQPVGVWVTIPVTFDLR